MQACAAPQLAAYYILGRALPASRGPMLLHPLLLLLLLLPLPTGEARLHLPPVFSDGLVLQTWAEGDARSFVYGEADLLSVVQLTMESADPSMPYSKIYTATADAHTGKWAVQLDGTYIADLQKRHGPKFGPYRLVVQGGGATVTVQNVTYGDVYVCAGGENMARAVGSVGSAAAAAIVSDAAHNFTSIRLFSAPNASVWGSASVASDLTDFSALCFLSGRAMQTLYNPTGTPPTSLPSNVTCPVGLISAAALGKVGAHLLDWAPRDEPSVRSACAGMLAVHAASDGRGQQATATGDAFETFLQPLQSLAIRGMFWSFDDDGGGLASAGLTGRGSFPGHFNYAQCFRACVESWRDGGEIGDWSLALTQQPGDDSAGRGAAGTAVVQLAQADARPQAGLVYQGRGLTTTSLAPLMDLTKPWLHEAARRLALGMLHTAFSKMSPQLKWGPPRFLRVESVSASGGAYSIALVFDARGVAPRGKEGQGPLLLQVMGVPGTTAKGADTSSSGGGKHCEALVQLGNCPANPHRSSTSSSPLLSPVSGGDEEEAVCQWSNATTIALFRPFNDTTAAAEWQLQVGFAFRPSAIDTSTASSLNTTRVRYGVGAGPGDCMLVQCHAKPDGVPVDCIPAVAFETTLDLGSSPPLFRKATVVPPDAVAATAEVASTAAERESGAIVPPPMGFNTWNRWHCWVNEHKLKETADQLLALGLAAAGYTNLNIDDCWQAHRALDAHTGEYNGTILAEPSRFPSGIKGIADYAHSKKLQFGIYTAQCSYTCQLKAGSYQHEAIDARFYCDNGVDYVKIDACGAPCHPVHNTSWIRFRAALDQCSHKVLMAVSSCGPQGGASVPECGQWVASGAVSADVWRTTGDIQATVSDFSLPSPVLCCSIQGNVSKDFQYYCPTAPRYSPPCVSDIALGMQWGSIMNNLDQNNIMAPVNHAHPGH